MQLPKFVFVFALTREKLGRTGLCARRRLLIVHSIHGRIVVTVVENRIFRLKLAFKIALILLWGNV